MTKNTMANKLPRRLTQKMQIVGGADQACQIATQPEHGTSCRKSNLLRSYPMQSGEGIAYGLHRNLPACALCASVG